MSALVFNEPHRLWERLVKWTRSRSAVSRFQFQGGLVDEELLLDWIGDEGDEFAPNLGGELRRELASAVERYGASLGATADRSDAPFFIDPDLRPGALAVFPSPESFLLHGIQDVLKMSIESASPRQDDRHGLSHRERLKLTPSELARRVREALDEAGTLSKLLRNQRDDYALVDFVWHLQRWVSYSTVVVRPNIPFSIEFDHTYVQRTSEGNEPSKLDLWLRRIKTQHHYPLPIKDALSVHVEVSSDEPEIEIGRRRVILVTSDRKKREDTKVFGHKFEPSARLVHRYSSKRPHEGLEPEAETLLTNRLFLETRVVLARNIRFAYLLAALSFAAAAVFVSSVSWTAIADESLKPLVVDAVAVGTIAIGLALWLVTTQYRVRLIHEKLFWARPVFYASILAIVVSVVAYAIRVTQVDSWSAAFVRWLFERGPYASAGGG